MKRIQRTNHSYAIIGACLLFFLVSCFNGQAQDIRTRTGFGYYNPQIGGDTGNIFYTDISIKLPTNFFVGVGFGLSDVFTTYGDEVLLFEGFRSIRNYYHFRLLISRELDFGKNNRHIINLGTGLTYIQLRYAEPFARLNQAGDELTIGVDESGRDQDDAGFLVNADYGYKVGKFIFGVHSELHLLFDVGLGGVVISPQIGIAF